MSTTPNQAGLATTTPSPADPMAPEDTTTAKMTKRRKVIILLTTLAITCICATLIFVALILARNRTFVYTHQGLMIVTGTTTIMTGTHTTTTTSVVETSAHHHPRIRNVRAVVTGGTASLPKMVVTEETLAPTSVVVSTTLQMMTPVSGEGGVVTTARTTNANGVVVDGVCSMVTQSYVTVRRCARVTETPRSGAVRMGVRTGVWVVGLMGVVMVWVMLP